MSGDRPPLADVKRFVSAGVAAQHGVDAAIAHACAGLVRVSLLHALAATDAAKRDAAMRQALSELGALERQMREHFERLGVRCQS